MGPKAKASIGGRRKAEGRGRRLEAGGWRPEAGRLTEKDYRRFVGHALGSASEVEYLLLLAEELGLLSDTVELRERVREVKRLLRGLERHLAA